MEIRELGLVSIVILWIAFAILLIKWRGHKGMSLSMHGSSTKAAYILFASVLIVHGILFHMFMLQWFIPQFKLNETFIMILNITMIFLYATAIIPDTSVLLKKIHRTVAFSMALYLFIIVVYVLNSVQLSSIPTVLGIVAAAFMVVTWIGLFAVKRLEVIKYFLMYQIVYVVSFQIFIISVTYLQ